MFTFFIVAMLTPTPQVYFASNAVNRLNNPELFNNENLITTISIDDSAIKNDIRPSEMGSPYTPITQFTDAGDNFIAEDNLAVNHIFNLNLTENGGEINDSYDITTISDYSASVLDYNITDMTAIQDFYPVESTATAGWREYLNRYESVALAQEFKVEWDYAKFFGAKILINYNNLGDPGAYELELLLVGANTTTPFSPNMSDVISTELGGPYDSANLPPLGTTNNIQFYDFTDVVLTKGSYYIVANLSVIDYTDLGTKDNFHWAKNILTPYEGKTFEMDNDTRSWTEQLSYDLTLIPELLASNVSGLPLIFSNPSEIDLKDNGISVTSTTQTISGAGLHVLTSNTSVQINFQNYYEFIKSYLADTSITALNSTYWETDIFWDINWTTPLIDIAPYSNLNRSQFVETPEDWNSTFTFYFNEVEETVLTGIWVSNGYLLLLNENNTAGIWKISTSSPNYISSMTLYDGISEAERYFLGYWEAVGSDAIGYEGSDIRVEAKVETDGATVPTDETTGILNYTLYDPNGQIVPVKGTYANIVYVDNSSYTISDIIYNISTGFYEETITFDPSYSGSDLAGFWTAAVFWQNGTEAGYYSMKIVVQTQTVFEYEWETEPNSDVWTTSDISRKGLDSFNVSTYYYNVSEPYLVGQRNPMADAVVSYDFHNATWSDTGFLDQNAAHYGILYNLSADVSVGVYTFDLLATGPFVENLTASFTVTVFYQLDMEPIVSYYNQTTYTDNSAYYFSLYDVTADSNLSTYTDINVQITNVTNTYNLTAIADYDFNYLGALWELDVRTDTNSLDVGIYDVFVEIAIDDYRANYSSEYVSRTFTLDIIAAQTSINVLTADPSIYVYHDADFSFNYVDTDHSINLVGATFTLSFNVTGIDYVNSSIGPTFYATITNNNSTLTGYIEVRVTIWKDNYETVTDALLGYVEILTITTQLTEEIVYTPASALIGYEFSVVVQFNDTIHDEMLDSFDNIILDINASTFDITNIDSLGNGLHNITIQVDDYTIPNLYYLNITLIVSKAGYYDATVSILLQVISIDSDAELIDSGTMTDVTTDYNTILIYEILYWDDISGDNITVNIDVDVISGNLTFSSDFIYSDNITTVEISGLLTLGYFELTITISSPGYVAQVIVISITVEEVDTIVETQDHDTSYDAMLYADELEELAILYATDNGTLVTIMQANITISFYGDNSTLSIEEYFDITNTTFGEYYIINFDPIDVMTVGGVFYIQIVFSSYGYETRIFYVMLEFYPRVSYDIDVDIIGDVQQLETIQFEITLLNNSAVNLQALSEIIIKYVPNPVGDFVTIEYTFVFANGTRMTYTIQVEIGSDLTALSQEILIPWQVVSIEYSVTYTPTNSAVIESTSTPVRSVGTTSPDFMVLLTYLFQEFTVYMIVGLALIAILFITLTVYFAAIRPKKQRKASKKKGYLDKISKILTSVLSLRKVIVVHNESGLPVYEWDLGGAMTVDSSLVSGFLQAVSGMGGEISGGEAQAVRKIDYGQFCVSSASTENLTTYLFSTGDISVDVEEGLSTFINWFEKKFQGTLAGHWDGVTDVFEQASRTIIDTLSENLYVWTLHPLSVNPVKEKDIVKLDSFSQKLYKFIKDYNEVTISVALEFFNKSPVEETLSKLFELVDNTFLLRKRIR